MQSLLLKSLVLTTVIGGSCFIVWLANENLQETQTETDPSQFAALENSDDSEGDGGVAASLDEFGSVDLLGDSDSPSTIPTQPEEDGLQPTLAKTKPFVPVSSTTIPTPARPLDLDGNFTEADSFEPHPETSSVAGPGTFPTSDSVDSPPAHSEEIPTIAAAPVMPLTFYSAGGNDVPRVEMAFDENNKSAANEEILPGITAEEFSTEPPMVAANRFGPANKPAEFASTERAPLRFGPATKPETEEVVPSLPSQPEEVAGLVKLPGMNTAPSLSSPGVLPSNSLALQDEATAARNLAAPILPIHKHAMTVKTAGVEYEIDNSVPAPAEEISPLNLPGPKDLVVQASNETSPTDGTSVGDNPFAKFQKRPMQTAALEPVEPSEIGFNSPPPQPSAPTVVEDPFGENNASKEVMPVGNIELAQNQPFPAELLPPIDTPVFPGQSEIAVPRPMLPMADVESNESTFPSEMPVLPIMAEPVPLPTAEINTVEEEAVFPRGLAPTVSSDASPPQFPQNNTAPMLTESEATNTIAPTPAFGVFPTKPNLPEPDIAPLGNSNFAQADVIPKELPIDNVAPEPLSVVRVPAAVMPVEFANEPTPEKSMSITPRALPTESSTATTPTASVNTFQNPTGKLEETLDRTISSAPQSPELKIEKIAPKQASIGEPLIYSIRIQNVGGSDARSVVVEDRIPKGTRLEGTIPQAVLTKDKLTWELGSIPPGEQRVIQLKVVPMQAGDIGSVATVSFEAAVAATIRVTAPELSVEIKGPTETLLGKNIPYKFIVKNSGQGNAKDVVLRAILPPALKHPNGSDIEANLNDIPAGESRTVDLVVVADDIGVFTPKVLIWMNGKDVAESRADVRVLESRIRLSRTGPKRRFVGRPADFVTQVTNDSSVMLTNITIEEQLPVSLNPASQIAGWDPQRRIIQRTIPTLQPGETKQFSTQLIPNQAGELVGKIVVRDQAGNHADLDTPLSVKGFADLVVDIHREKNVVPVGDQVSFRLNLKNSGTATANQVRAEFEIPQGLIFASATGPSSYRLIGNKIQFDPLDEITVNSEESYDIVLTAAEECNTKVKIALHSAEYSEPINREEAVRVVSDAP